MEAATAIMYSEQSVNGKRDARWQRVIVHELAHQWFGDAVTEADWDDVWLSEGFATFFTLLYIEHASGRDEFIAGLKTSREQIVTYLQKNADSPIVHNQLNDMKKVTSTLTYQKGAWVLHMLRERLGESNFTRGIKSYYKKYLNANATTSQFKYEMEQASGQDLTLFFDQWLYHDGIPAIKGQWRWDNRKKEIQVTLEQTQQTVFSFPLDIGIQSAEKQSINRKNVVFSTRQAHFTFPMESRPVAVSLDPKTNLLATFDFEAK